jgi:hypothetical protein
MRLQLRSRWPRGTLGLIACIVVRSASAEPAVSVDGRSAMYADDDHTSISTSTAAARVTPVPRVTVKGRYLIDVITTASVDVVSAATGRWDEIRHEGEGALAYGDGTRTASASYIRSFENDWSSHTFTAGAASDFFEHTLTIGASGSVVLNDVGRAGDANFHEELTQIGASFSATLVPSKADLVSATYSLVVARGYQASPYRYVDVHHELTGMPIGHPESHPDMRVRHALGLKWNHHAFRDTAIRSALRGYVDDWGVASGTLSCEWVAGFGDAEVAPFLRGYAQTGAVFYRSAYVEQRQYMSADRELSPFVDGFGGLRFGWRHRFGTVVDELRADARAQAFVFRFFDFPLLEQRRGLVADVGLGGSF